MLKPGVGVGAVCTVVLAFGCSDDAGSPQNNGFAAAGAVGSGAGGAAAAGGSAAGGGATMGGSVATGGSVVTGGSATGGSVAAAGAAAGGEPNIGGEPNVGVEPSAGGAPTIGGEPNAGGATTMAGAPGTDQQGGSPAMGGMPMQTGGSGGEPAAGGSPPEPVDMGPVMPPAGAKADPALEGFAAVEKYGLKTTTGGSGGETVKVSSFDDFKKHLESRDVVIVEVSGTISAPGEHALIKVQSNKTIIGAGGGATLNKITLSVNSWNKPGESCDADDYGTFTPASNVIIRNLEFKGLDKFPDKTGVDPDGIRVECYSHHVWIDHNTFQYGADGATDVKRGADMVTLSYNHYVKTQKTALVGHSNDTGDQDRGFLNVTFHHNHFDNTETRTPRVRWGYVHVYNNYYLTTNHVFRIGPEGKIYAEANYVASKEGKILRSTEVEGGGALTWTTSNVWDKGIFGDIGADKLFADQSVKKPSYSYNAGSAPSSPPAAGVGKL